MTMRWSLLARYSAYAVAAILAVSLTIALTLDFGRFKGSAEVLVSRLLDREVVIDGPLHLTLGRTINLSAEDVRLASTRWSADPQLASARRIEARISTASLISRTIRIESLSIDGARVNLERNAELERNWALFGPAEEPSEAASSNLPERLPIMINDTRLTDTILNYTTPDRSRPIRFTMNELTEEIDEFERVHITLQGDINETPLDLEATAGLVENLIQFTGAEFELSGNLGEIGLEGNASFTELLHPSRPTARLNLTGPSVEYLTDILRIERVTSGPLDLSLSISPLGERMQLNLSGNVGEFVLLANGEFVDLQQANNVDLQVSASGPSARTVADTLGWPNVPDDPFNIIGAVQRSGSVVSLEEIRVTIGETQFDISAQFDNFPNPNGANATVRVNGPDFGRFNRLLGLPGRLEGPFELEADLMPLEVGGARVELSASAQDITFSVDGTVTDTPNLLGTQLRVEFAGPDLSVITRAAGLALGPEAPFTGALTAQRVADAAIIEDGAATVGADRFAFNGRVGDQLPLSWELEIEAASLDLKTRLAEFGIQSEQLPPGDLAATGSVRSEGDGFTLENLALSYADAEAQLSGRIGMPPTMTGTTLALQASGEAFSRWLPPRDAFSALDKPFNLEGNIRLVDGTLALSAVQFQIEETQLTGDAEFSLDSPLDHGSFSLVATSPDIFALAPRIAELAVQNEAPLELRAAGDWADNLWNLREVDMSLADGSLQAGGTIDGPPNFSGTDLRLDWNISSISNFSILAGHELPDEPAHLQFHLTGTNDEMSIDDFDGIFGDSDIHGEFSLHDGDVPTLAVNLTSNRLNLTPYLPPERELDAEQDAEPEPANERLIPDIPIRIELLENLLANIEIRVNEMVLRERTLRNVALIGSVADSNLRVSDFNIEDASGGTLSGLMVLRPAETGAELGIRVFGNDLSVGLPAYSAEELEALPRYELNLALITTGGTLREMAGSMNGYLRLVGGEGRMQFGAMRIFTQDFFYELLNTLNPFSATDPYSNLKCVTVLASVEDGTLVGDPVLVVQSDRLNIFANAEVDLKTEQVDADFNTVPQKGLGFSLSNLVNPYVKVSGTLADPSLGFDPGSTLIEGGAAVATSGLSILAKSFADRFLSSRDPCGKAITDADEEFQALEEKYGRADSAAWQ